MAAGLVPLAHGSDGGGSIRIPASCCGVFGFKPSRGRVSSSPFSSLEGLSTAGPLARSVADAAAFLDVLAGYEPGDPWWAPPPERPFSAEVGEEPGRLRIALTTLPPIEAAVDPECVAAARSAAALLEDLGHEVEDASPPWDVPGLIDDFITVWQVGPTLYPVDVEQLTPLNRSLAARARETSAAEYGAAVIRLQASARRIVAFWGRYDAVLTPTLALPPVPIGWQEEGVDRRARAAPPQHAVHAVHGRREPHRSAGDVTSAARLERRAPDRRAADRPSRGRRAPPPACSSAGDRPPLAREPTSDLLSRRLQRAGVIRMRWPGEACSIRAALPREIATDMFP